MYVQRVFFMLWHVWRGIPLPGVKAAVSVPLLALLTACTDGIPKFGDLGNSIPAPTGFDQTSGLYIITSFNQTLTIKGICDRRSLGFELKPEAGSWISTAPDMNLSSELDCSDGQFVLSIPDAGAVFGFTDGQTGERSFSLRVLSEVGASPEASLKVRYLTTVPEVNLVSDVQGVEGSVLVFTASLSTPADLSTEVGFITAVGTAGVTDFKMQTGTITFAVGESVKTISIETTADVVHENDEVFTLSLINPVGANLGGNSSASGTIENDDPLPEVNFFVATSSAMENAGVVNVQVQIVGAIDQFMQLALGTASGPGIAELGMDYHLDVLVNVPPETTGLLNVPVTLIDDLIFEGDEVVRLSFASITNGNVALFNTQHDLTIIDNEALPTVSFMMSNQSTPEMNTVLSLSVSLGGESATPVSVSYAVNGGGTTASVPSDYEALGGTLIFPAGSLAPLSVNVTIKDDFVFEGDETIEVVLTSPIGASLGPITSSTITISENDPKPVLSFVLGTMDYDEPPTGATTHDIDVSLSAASAVDITVPVTLGGDAEFGAANDYIISPTSVVFPMGAASVKSITITIHSDLQHEGNETAELGLGVSTAHYDIGFYGVHYALIRDNTAPGVFSIDGVSGGGDGLVDGYLSATATPHVHWSSALGADFYRVVILASDNITVVCGPQDTVGAPTDHLVDGCSLANDAYNLRVEARKVAGNGTAAANANFPFVVDTIDPRVSYVMPSTWGEFAIGDHLRVEVVFDEPVFVTGSPLLPLLLHSGHEVQASYFSGSGSSSLVFNYEVVDGDWSSVPIYPGAGLNLNGGQISDAAGVMYDPGLDNISSFALFGIDVDGVRPTVLTVTPPSAGTYGVGQHLEFEVQFSETLGAGSGSELPLLVGGQSRTAAFYAQLGDRLVYRYSVQPGDQDTDGVEVGASLSGVVVTDLAGNEMNDFTIPFLGPFTGVQIQTLISWDAMQVGLAREGDLATLRVTLAAAAAQDITLTYSTSSGTATGNIDYVELTSNTAVLPNGSATVDIPFTTLPDTIDEPDEIFHVVISSPLLETKPAFTITISDDDVGAPQLSYSATNCAALSPNFVFNRSSMATFFDDSGAMATASPGQPRCEHHPLTGEPLGLLVEGERTNFLSHSTEFQSYGWTHDMISVQSALPDRQAPDGSGTVTRLNEVVSGSPVEHSLRHAFSASAGETYTFSMYMHGENRNWIRLAIKGLDGNWNHKWFNLNITNGGEGPASPGVVSRVELLGEWSRYSMTANVGSGGASPEVSVVLGIEDGPDADLEPDHLYIGALHSGVRVWGAQLEKGGFASSYIPTYGTASTRQADQVQVANLAPFDVASPGTIQVLARQPDSSSQSWPRTLFALEDSAIPGNPSGYRMSSIDSGGVRWRFVTDNNGSTQTRLSSNVVPSTLSTAFSYNGPGARTSAAVNGASIADIVQTIYQPLPAYLNTLSLGSSKSGAHFFGHLQAVNYFNLAHNRFELEEATKRREVYFNYSSADIFRNESIGTFDVTAYVTEPFLSTTFVPFTVKGMVEDAGAHKDFTSSSYDEINQRGQFTFAPGMTSATVTITVVNDNHHEEDEDLFVLFQADPAYTIGHQFYRQFSVLDDDPIPTIDLIPISVSVSEAGTQVNLAVSLSGSNGYNNRMVWYHTNPGTADTSDYGAVSNSFSVPQYVEGIIHNISIPILNDGSVFEGDEYFTVSLNFDSDAFLAGANITSTIVIEDDDPLPTVGFQNPGVQAVPEGSFVTLPVTLSSMAALPTTVHYSWLGSGGLDFSDHDLAGGSVVIPAYQNVGYIAFNILTDGPDPGESITVTLESPSVGGYATTIEPGRSSVTIDIEDSGGGGVLSFASPSVAGTEGEVVALALTLSPVQASDTTFQLSWSGAAGVANDINPNVGDLYLDELAVFTIASGQTSLNVNVTLHADGRDAEGNEEGLFSIVNLSPGISYSGLNLALTINNRLPEIEVEMASRFPLVVEGELATIGVSLSRVSDQPVTFSLVTDNANGATTNDYEIAGAPTVTIPSGQTKAYVPVPVFHDPIWGNGLLNPILKLQNLFGATATLSSSMVSLTISDNSEALEAQMVSAGSDFSCAVVNGGVLCWGANNYGQLGRGTTDGNINDLPEWVSGLGPGSGATMVSAGVQFACAVIKGGAKCWGMGTFGRLGNNGTFNSPNPVDVFNLGPGSGVTKVVAGNAHSCAIARGEIHCWGRNDNGALGNDSLSTQSLVPVATVGDEDNNGLGDVSPIAGATDIAIGANGGSSDHTCAVVRGGVMCWGANAMGQLGRPGGGFSRLGRWVAGDRYISPPAPTIAPMMMGMGSGVTAIASGMGHSCAVQNDSQGNTVVCWGNDLTGNLGDGSFSAANGNGNQTYVTGFDSGSMRKVYSLSSLAATTCAVSNEGTFCWGSGSSGQLGNGGTTNQQAPVAVSGYDTASAGVKSVGVGQSHVCAVVRGGVSCWGAGGNGRLGMGSANRTTPVNVSRLGGLAYGVNQLSSSVHGSCTVKHGDLFCWGNNNFAQLAQSPGSPPKSTTPMLVSQLNGTTDYVSKVAVGDQHVCAIVSGRLKCWGSNDQGRLGNGTGSGTIINPQLLSSLSNVTDVAAGFSHTCAIAHGNTYCWGNGPSLQLGQGGMYSNFNPGQVSSLPTGLSQSVAVGPENSCAVVDSKAHCWGNNSNGQLGGGSAGGPLGNAVQVVDMTMNPLQAVTQIAVGLAHACAISREHVYCWGHNSSGQLGNGTYSNSPRAVKVMIGGGMELTGATEIAAANNTTCALVKSELVCWGANQYEIFGSPVPHSSFADQRPLGWRAPLSGPSGGGAHALSLGPNHICVAKMNQLHCWGRNFMGTLGIGEALDNITIPYGRLVSF